jgi:hypothetical protein
MTSASKSDKKYITDYFQLLHDFLTQMNYYRSLFAQKC